MWRRRVDCGAGPPPSFRVVEDDTEGRPLPPVDPAHAVAHLGAMEAATAPDRTLGGREHDGLTLGEREGVARGQAAVTGSGLAGRVAQVGQRASRVLLVTDMNSRIPVLVGEARERAVLAGDNTGQPHLVYLGRQARLTPGERVVTSGHGGVFPPGLPIGTVASLEEGVVRVQPFVDWSAMEYLRLANYELPGILSAFHQGSGRADGPR